MGNNESGGDEVSDPGKDDFTWLSGSYKLEGRIILKNSNSSEFFASQDEHVEQSLEEAEKNGGKNTEIAAETHVLAAEFGNSENGESKQVENSKFSSNVGEMDAKDTPVKCEIEEKTNPYYESVLPLEEEKSSIPQIARPVPEEWRDIVNGSGEVGKLEKKEIPSERNENTEFSENCTRVLRSGRKRKRSELKFSSPHLSKVPIKKEGDRAFLSYLDEEFVISCTGNDRMMVRTFNKLYKQSKCYDPSLNVMTMFATIGVERRTVKGKHWYFGIGKK